MRSPAALPPWGCRVPAGRRRARERAPPGPAPAAVEETGGDERTGTAAAGEAPAAGRGSEGRPRKPQSVWELLPRVEPALCEWAAFFAAGASKRAAAEAGPSRAAA